MTSDTRPVELAAHDPSWAQQAIVHGDALRAALGATLIEVHHIGSTSILGIKAKPTIDLMPIARSLDELDAKSESVCALGYEWRGEFGIAGRRFCPLTDVTTGKRLVNVHFYAPGNSEIGRHLLFRDYLRAHRDEALAYQADKERAAALHPDSVLEYTSAKDAWIAACDQRALAWARAR